jgi:hypothetical protein
VTAPSTFAAARSPPPGVGGVAALAFSSTHPSSHLRYPEHRRPSCAGARSLRPGPRPPEPGRRQSTPGQVFRRVHQPPVPREAAGAPRRARPVGMASVAQHAVPVMPEYPLMKLCFAHSIYVQIDLGTRDA